MQLETRRTGDQLYVRAGEARLDAAVAIRFKDRFRDALDDAVRRVVLDLSQVEFIDSSGLGAVVAVLKLAGPERSFTLAGLNPAVEKVFRLTRMDTVFTIEPAGGARADAPDAVRAGTG
ncbi:anti-sigma factor antagonist [Maritimibacter sp. 55A14]|uniref:STAS domain-containing protein n=1 Tax=Maritimibacter sp. 55A14 TaxID=2174844 RepID=UPI000D60BD93|nr:STAS domain-containing protein [Maritimibacter sp. 55A14]PWE28890.1 anti-sigma factor antagonist [Maritimibacter sp. 55A14]